MTRLGACAMALMVLLQPMSSEAQQQGDATTAQALFKEARAELSRGEVAAACAKFEESLRLEPTLGTKLNLAACEEQLGHLMRAWRYWNEAIEELRRTNDNRLRFAESRASALDRRLPRLVLRRAEGAPAGTSVKRDGVELKEPSFGTPLPIDPGDHVLEIAAPGHRDSRRAFRISEGERLQVDVAPGPADESRPTSTGAPLAVRSGAPRERARPSASASGDGPGPSRTIGWIVTGVGVVGLAAAGVTGVMALEAQRTVDADCPSTQCTTVEGYDAARQGKTLLVLNAMAWAVGIVGSGVGIYLVASSPGVASRPAQPAYRGLTVATTF
jgi:hypothetical protein